MTGFEAHDAYDSMYLAKGITTSLAGQLSGDSYARQKQ